MRFLLCIIIMFFSIFPVQARNHDRDPKVKNNQVDTATVYVIFQRDCCEVVHSSLTGISSSKNWIDCILDASHVNGKETAASERGENIRNDKKSGKQEIKPFDEIRIDKYYWLHSLDKQAPDII